MPVAAHVASSDARARVSRCIPRTLARIGFTESLCAIMRQATGDRQPLLETSGRAVAGANASAAGTAAAKHSATLVLRMVPSYSVFESVEATCPRELSRTMVVSRAALLCAFFAGGLAGASAFVTAPVGCVVLRGRRVGQGLSLAATRPRSSERLKMVAASKRNATPPTLKKPTTLEGQAIPASMEVVCPWRALCFT